MSDPKPIANITVTFEDGQRLVVTSPHTYAITLHNDIETASLDDHKFVRPYSGERDVNIAGSVNSSKGGSVEWMAPVEHRCEAADEALEGYWERAYWRLVPVLLAALASAPVPPEDPER